jgi:hypothetical protein
LCIDGENVLFALLQEYQHAFLVPAKFPLSHQAASKLFDHFYFQFTANTLSDDQVFELDGVEDVAHWLRTVARWLQVRGSSALHVNPFALVADCSLRTTYPSKGMVMVLQESR